MPESEEPAETTSAPDATSAAHEPPSGRPTSAEVLERVGGHAKPLNLNAEHQKRINEAIVRREETEADQAGDNRSLRMKIAVSTSITIAVQLLIADVVFVVYGAANSWDIPGSTVSAWLAAAVVQVIALGVIIVRSLFPPEPK